MSAAGRLRSHLVGSPTVATLVGACLLAVVLSACGGSDTTGPTEADRAIRASTTADTAPTRSTGSTTSTSTSPPTTTPIKGEEEQVKAAYLSTVNAYYRRLEAPDTNAADLPGRYGEESLKVVKDELEQLSRDGQHAVPTDRGIPVPVIESVTLGSKGSSAKVTFCLVDDVRIVNSSGAVVNDDVSSRRGRAVLRRSTDHWIVESQSLVQRWPDGRGCR